MATQVQETVGQWLERLAEASESTDQDSTKMANLLHRVGFPLARVVVGIVYLEGKGTLDYPPQPLHTVAKLLANRLRRSGG